MRVALEWPEAEGAAGAAAGVRSGGRAAAAGHTLAVTETALAFLEDALRRGETCLPLDWIPEVHHPIGNGEAVIPYALLYYRSGAMLRAFVEVDRATMWPERLAAKLTAYARLHRYIPGPAPGRRPHINAHSTQEVWRQRYPLFPRLLFVLDSTGSTGVQNRIQALHALTGDPAVSTFLTTSRPWSPRSPTSRSMGPPHPYGGPSRTPIGSQLDALTPPVSGRSGGTPP